MGATLARVLNETGHETRVRNRSSEKAAALVAAGVTRAETVADAVAASPLVITCVLDDAALRSLLYPVAGELSGRALINLTSGTPENARATAAWAAEHGIDHLDGKILAFPSTIGTREAAEHRTPSPATSRRSPPSAAPTTSAPIPGSRRCTTSAWSA
jgi:3-hydroxyisobutyrate dehydrogenase-like beta-hydroxyacid dehydrogenase